MPTYEFRNKETGEVTEHIMRISERDQFILDNPHLQQTITIAPAFAGDRMTVKHDTGFKEVLQKINERNPHNDLSKTSSQL
jgi:hypothetical protein